MRQLKDLYGFRLIRPSSRIPIVENPVIENLLQTWGFRRDRFRYPEGINRKPYERSVWFSLIGGCLRATPGDRVSWNFISKPGMPQAELSRHPRQTAPGSDRPPPGPESRHHLSVRMVNRRLTPRPPPRCRLRRTRRAASRFCAAWRSVFVGRVSTAVVQRFCKPKVGGSIPSPGTISSPPSPVVGRRSSGPVYGPIAIPITAER